ncbi:MAG: CGNR zinc finger domain-containing protein [Sphingomonadales bacterium]
MVNKKSPSSTLCLEFSNKFSKDEHFDYEKLIIWAKNSGTTNNITADQLLEYSKSYPFKTDPVIFEAKILAKTINHIYASIAEGKNPLEEDVVFLNGSIEKTFQNLIITPTTSLKFRWGWKEPQIASPEQPLWRIILNAGETLVETNPKKIKKCEGLECYKLFIDKSKAGRRKWCSMETCGNRTKTRKYRERTK